MKKIVVVLALLISFGTTWATHSTGLDLTYQCIGGDTFYVQLAFYRDCEGVDAPGIGGRPLPTIDIFSNTCGQNFNETLALISSSEAGTVCATLETTCAGGTYPGIEEYIYGDTIVLPSQCIDWTFSYGLCCRNNAITTINPTNVDIYVEAELNNLAVSCNNSPVFTNTPVPFVCVGSSYCFNNGAVDVDGDSLYYQLVTPTTGPNPQDTVQYVAGFSATNPITSSPGLSLDPITGDICMLPTQLEVTVMQVQIEEWRAGVLIGIVERDIQIRVIDCQVPNNLPTVNGIDGSGVFSASICAGTPFEFFTNAIDPDAGQNITMTWNNGIADATFTVTPDSLPTGNFSWTPDSTDISTAPQCFTVSVVDDNCPFLGSQVFSFCITVFGYMETTVVPQDVSCPGDCDGQATVNVVGGFPPYTFLWDDPLAQTSATANNLCPGTYSVTVTDSIGCTPENSGVVNPSLPISLTMDSTAISCNGANDGTGTVVATGGTGAGTYTYIWNSVPVQNTPTATGLIEGVFTVTVTDGNGCDTAAAITIVEPDVLSVSLLSQENVSCNGLADGVATITIDGGTPPYSILWDLAAGSQTDSVAIGLGVGNYSATVTDSSGCTANVFVNITQPQALLVNLIDTIDVDCFGGNNGSSIVSVSGGTYPYFFLWDAAAGNQTDSVAIGLFAGNYQVVVTDSNNCADSATTTITEPATAITLTINTSPVSCFGGDDGLATATPAGGTPPYTYLWDPTTGNQTDSTAINLSAGTYGVLVADINDCVYEPGVVIYEPTPMLVTTSSLDVNCFAGSDGEASVSVTGGISPYTILWDAATGNQAGTTASNLDFGIYQVSITDSNGCLVDTSIAVGQPIAGIALSGSTVDLDCFGDADGSATVSITGGTVPYTILWDAAAANQTDTIAINLSAQSYQVMVTDTNDCIDSLTLTVAEPDLLVATISDSIAVNCFGGNDGSATVSVTGGTTPYAYLWNAAANNQTDSTATNLSVGTYSVIVTDTNGCTDSTAIVISEPLGAITLAFTTTAVSCFGGSDGTATATPSGGTPPYTYVWDSLANNQTDSTAIGLAAGTYAITVYDINDCIFEPSIVVSQPDSLVLSVSPNDTACPGVQTVIGASAVGGNGGYVFNWNQGLPSFANHSVAPPVATTYSVSVTDALGCSTPLDSLTLHLYEFDLTGISTASGGDVCLGDSTTVTGNYSGGIGSYSYSWNQGLGNSLGTFDVVPSDTTDYILTVTNQCNTSISDTVTINVFQFPNINLPAIYAEGCNPLTVYFVDSLNANGTMNYLWEFGDGVTSTQANPIHVYNGDGTYAISVTITSLQGCSSTSGTSSVVNVFPAPTAFFSANPEIVDTEDPRVTFTNQSVGGNSYSWDFGNGITTADFNPVHVYGDTGTFNVNLLVTSINGCTDSYQYPIRVKPFFTFSAPNAFTPKPGGGNGGSYDINSLANDVFFPFTEFVDEYELLIFNRWGELLFVSNDINIGWDGYYRGDICQQDVYVWKINITYTTGEKKSEVGDLTLMR